MTTSLNLKFTARDVAAVEEALDGSIEKIIASFKLKTLIQFLMVGMRDKDGNRLDLDEDKIFDLLDEVIKKNGKIELQIQVIDALIDAGFLPKAVNTKELRQTLSEAIADASKMNGES